jgi:hypothetical protein
MPISLLPDLHYFQYYDLSNYNNYQNAMHYFDLLSITLRDNSIPVGVSLAVLVLAWKV